MRFSFGADQIQFQAGVRHLLASEYPVAALRRDWQDRPGSWRDVWTRLADMGVTGLTVPEVHGGMGQDELSLVLILEEAGYAGLAAPLADSVAVATPLLVDLLRAQPCEQAEHWLSEAAAGRAVIGVGLGGPTHPYIQDADVVDAVVVARHGDIYVTRPDELDLVRQPSIDRGRRLFEVGPYLPRHTRVAGGAEDAIDAAFDRAVLAGAAQMVGVAARLVEMAGAYASERKQFGAPIGSFQAVKHLMADALCRLEFARPVVYRAAHSVARDLPERSRHVSAAKVFAGEAASVAARTALQVHGAIGYTWEADVHLWMKRAWALGADWGDETFHTDRVARLILGPRPQ